MVCQKYLLIIDDVPVDEQFRDYFSKFGFEIVQLTSLSHIDSNLSQPAALLINCSLLQTGLITVNTLYHQYPVPLVVISDTVNEALCVCMLENGADDFIIKPINPRELHARIGAINRRVQRAILSADKGGREVLLFANWRLYPGSRQLINETTELRLSTNEFDLLLAFARQPLCILSRNFLLQTIKNSASIPLNRRIDVQISRLRQKIELEAKRPSLIKTIRHGGYMFAVQVSSAKEWQ